MLARARAAHAFHDDQLHANVQNPSVVDPKRPRLDTVDLGWEDDTGASDGADATAPPAKGDAPADPEAIERTIVDDHPGLPAAPAEGGFGETHVLPSDELDKLVDRSSGPDLGPTEALERADVERLLASDRAANARMPNRVTTPGGAPPRGGPAAPRPEPEPPPPEPDFDLAFGGGEPSGELAAAPAPAPRAPSRPELDAPSSFDNAPTVTTAARDVPFAVVAEDEAAGGSLAGRPVDHPFAPLDGADTATEDATPLPAAAHVSDQPPLGLDAVGEPPGLDGVGEPPGLLGVGEPPGLLGGGEPLGSHGVGAGLDVPMALPAAYADETTNHGTQGRTGTTPPPRAPTRARAPSPPLVTAVVGGALAAVVVAMVLAWAFRGPKAPAAPSSGPVATAATPAPTEAPSARSLMPPPASAMPRETGPVEEEARLALTRLRDGVAQCVRDTIGVLPGTSPAVPALWSMVAKTGAYASNQRDWKKPVWACTHFTVGRPQRFQIQWQLVSKTEGQAVVWFDEDRDGKAERALRARATLQKKGSAEFGEIEAVEPPAVAAAR